MKIKLLILAGFVSCLWSVRELPVPQIDQALYQTTPAPENLEGHWQSVANKLPDACPVSAAIKYGHNPDFELRWQESWKKLCLTIYKLHNQMRSPQDDCIIRCNNYFLVDCFCLAPLLTIILGGEVCNLDAIVYKRKHKLVEILVGHSIVPDETEVNIKNALCKYCAQCFGGTLALLGGNLKKITTDYEFLNIICSFEQDSYLVKFKLDLKSYTITLKPQVQRITEPEAQLY